MEMWVCERLWRGCDIAVFSKREKRKHEKETGHKMEYCGDDIYEILWCGIMFYYTIKPTLDKYLRG